MSLAPGSTLGVYEVTAKIGEGGMGEVYQARDTTLDRDVALKVLPEAFTSDPERLARFEREAKVLASLNHPNIGGIHGLEAAEGLRALVLELVDGPTLADRIARGPIPLDEALPLATQIAEALEAAHEAGVVHRDLKPANIKVREDGTVKVLDFGLAKALDTAPEGDPSLSPTLTAAATEMGVILGTAAYMAPEQARGKPVDKRADIWAFGAVLYEMLTGARAFAGDDISATLAKVIEREPDLDVLPGSTPAAVVHLLRRCLVKDPKRRLRDIGDAHPELDEARHREADASDQAGEASGAGGRPGRRPFLGWVAAAVVGAVVAGVASWLVTPGADLPLRRSERVIEGFLRGGTPRPSPDGQRLFYRTAEGLWTWDLAELAPREVRDENGASPTTERRGFTTQFWSHDGQDLAFSDGGNLVRVPASGGRATRIAEFEGQIMGGAWLDDDTVLFAEWRSDVFEVSAAGGTPRVYLSRDPDTEVDFHRLEPLPNGRGLLYSVHAREGTHIGVLDDGTRRRLIENASAPAYAPSGHLVYQDLPADRRDTRIWAVGFDLSSLTVTGEPFVVASGAGPYVSSDGTLLYSRVPETTGLGQLVWMDRDGADLGTLGQPQENLANPVISPDGGRVAAYAQEDAEPGVWVYETTRGTRTRVATWEGGIEAGENVAWRPDGSEILFAPREGMEFFNDLMAVAADGSSEPRVVVSGEGRSMPRRPSISPDGRWLAFTQGEQAAVTNLRLLELDGEGQTEPGQPEPFLGADGTYLQVVVSPTGSHAAYVIREAGIPTIYLTEFPSGEGRWRVSLSSGAGPRWRADGGELFYVDEDSGLMAVSIETEPEVSVGVAEELFSVDDLAPSGYDVAADGSRFVFVRSLDDAAAARIAVVQNWFAEFADRAEQ